MGSSMGYLYIRAYTVYAAACLTVSYLHQILFYMDLQCELRRTAELGPHHKISPSAFPCPIGNDSAESL